LDNALAKQAGELLMMWKRLELNPPEAEKLACARYANSPATKALKEFVKKIENYRARDFLAYREQLEILPKPSPLEEGN
jgi:hypothetical protein